MVEREGGVEVRTVAAHAFAHGARERGFRPAADPGVGIRRDVAGVDRAEWRGYRKTASKGFAARAGMAGGAVADGCKFGTGIDQCRIERGALRQSDGIDRRLPCVSEEACTSDDDDGSKPEEGASGFHINLPGA